MKRILSVLVPLILSGCGGVPVTNVGPNTYMASGGSVYGNTRAASEACGKQGKQVRVMNVRDAYWGGEVVFTCMSPSDPNYNKPLQFENSPNVIIQDNRKK